MHTVSNFYARVIARELNIKAKQWLEFIQNTQQTQHTIINHSEMPLVDFDQIVKNALKMSNDPSLGLRFGKHCNLMSLGQGGLVGISAPTLLESLRAIEDFGRLQVDYLTMEIKVGVKYFSFRANADTQLQNARIQHEVFIFTIQNTIEQILGREFVEGKYSFPHKKPSYHQLYQDAFHSPFEFNTLQMGVDIPRDLINIASPFYDSVLWEKGRNRALSLMSKLHNDERRLHSSKILSLLRSQIPPLPNFIEVANWLNLSQRSLARRLSEEKHTYRQLQTIVLKEWAHHYLTESSYSIDAIACQLGYQDSANFRRAFKQWFAISPHQYRQNNTDKK